MFCIWSMSHFAFIVFFCFRVAWITCNLLLYNCLPVIVLFYAAWSNTSETLFAYETRQRITWKPSMYLKPKLYHRQCPSTEYTSWSTRADGKNAECVVIAPTSYVNLTAGARRVKKDFKFLHWDSQAKSSTGPLKLSKIQDHFGEDRRQLSYFENSQTDSTVRRNRYLKFKLVHIE